MRSDSRDIPIDDSGSSKRYFQQIASLAERLAKKRLSIYEHRFHYLAFGSWEIVAGTRERQLNFNYDGKDSYLMYRDASVKPRGPDDFKHHTFKTWKGEDPLAFIAEVLEREFTD
ncbi:MAG TPA: hypothetical protein VK843_19315 [Planctomycetota bacterium]|nr:hypothetical protein [Planctomycetota bacterium]